MKLILLLTLLLSSCAPRQLPWHSLRSREEDRMHGGYSAEEMNAFWKRAPQPHRRDELTREWGYR